LVSRFRSSHHCAAHSFANFGIKGTLAIYDSSAIFGFEVPTRTRGYNDRNFKSTALGDTVKFFGNDQPSLPLCVRLGRSRSPPRLPRLNPAGPPRRGFAFQATEAASVFGYRGTKPNLSGQYPFVAQCHARARGLGHVVECGS